MSLAIEDFHALTALHARQAKASLKDRADYAAERLRDALARRDAENDRLAARQYEVYLPGGCECAAIVRALEARRTA